MNRANFLLVLSSAALIGISIALNEHDCGSKVGKVKSIRVSGCESPKNCRVQRDQNHSVELKFTVNKDINNFFVDGNCTNNNWFSSNDIYQMQLTNTHPCNHHESGITCPLKKGETYTWKGKMNPALTKDLFNFLYYCYFQVFDSESKDKVVCLAWTFRML